jgi:hypothetical protein
MRVTLKKNLLISIEVGMLFGLAVGCLKYKCDFGDYRYIDYHLYNTALSGLISRVDLYTLYALVAWYGIWLALLGYRRMKGGRAIYWMRSFAVSLAAVIVLFRFGSQCAELNYVAVKYAVLDENWVQPALGLLCVGGCILLLKRIRRNRPAIRSHAQHRISFRFPTVWMNRIPVVLCPVAVIFVLLHVCAGALRAQVAVSCTHRPNVILITVDTLRSDHLGCYGYGRNTSPNIDRLAAHAIRFENARSQSSWTQGSVSSFMTSRYPQTVLPREGKLYSSELTMDQRLPTMGQILKEAGYDTGAVISNAMLISIPGWSKGYDYWDSSQCFADISSPGVLSRTLKWLDSNENKRFFLYTLFMDPHSPYCKHKGFDFDSNYAGPMRNVVDFGIDSSNHIKLPCSLEHIQSSYDSEIAFTDYHIGLLLDSLKRRGLYDDSLIVFLGDHGEELRDHGRFFHGLTLYRELLHVPLIIKLPHQTRGEVVTKLYPLIDLLPTVLQAIGCDPAVTHPAGKAVSLQRSITVPDEPIFGATRLEGKNLRSMEDSRYKYILDLAGSHDQLFDMRLDPLEQNNILGVRPDVASNMKTALMAKEAQVSCGDQTFVVQDNKSAAPVSSRVRDKLKALGYAQ